MQSVLFCEICDDKNDTRTVFGKKKKTNLVAFKCLKSKYLFLL